jgi:hypothetical protein
MGNQTSLRSASNLAGKIGLSYYCDKLRSKGSFLSRLLEENNSRRKFWVV